MTEDNTPLHQIIWQRFLKVLGPPPSMSHEELDIAKALRRHWLELVQALLITVAVGLAVQVHPVPLGDLWEAAKSKAPGIDKHPWWYAAALAVLLSVGFRWVLGLVARLWRHCVRSSFRPLLAGGAIALIGWGSYADAYQPWSCVIGYILFFSVMFSWLRRPPSTPAVVADDLHRRYFVNRLAEIFCTPATSVRRVAILGEWGAGKTQVLSLLAQRLKQERRFGFRVGFVNPWKAKTVEEAWALVAAEVDRTLGYASFLPKLWANHPLLRGLIDLLPLQGVSSELLKLLVSGGQESRDATIAKVNSCLAAQKTKLVLLIDDMERTDPKVLRQLFPIIDQLAGLNGVSFVFAIDADRIAAAFGEEKRSGDQTKGYLDKVFDLQIELPLPGSDDVRSMLHAEAAKQKAAKFVKALPLFEALLPNNPRLSLRFLEVAVTNERLFLDRYGPNEKAYAPLFLSWLADVEFPGFINALVESKRDFEVVSQTPLFSENTPIRNQERFQPLLTKMCEALSVLPADGHDTAKERLATFIERLAELSGSYWDRLVEGHESFSLEWAQTGYKVPTELSHSERERLRIRWQRDAGQRSIQEMIKGEFSSDEIEFADNTLCANQLICFEIDRIIERLRAVRRGGVGDKEQVYQDLISDTARLTRHHKFAAELHLDFDLKCFDTSVFEKWIEQIVEQPLGLEENESGGRLDAARTALSFEMAATLPLAVGRGFAIAGAQRVLEHRGDGRNVDRAKVHLGELRKTLMQRVTDHVLVCLRSHKLDELFDESGIAGKSGWLFLFDPRNWLCVDDVAWKHVMESLAAEAKESGPLAQSCAEICLSLFAHPAHCVQCGGAHARERAGMQKLESDHQGYISAFWRAGLALPEENPDRVKLLRDRQRALERAGLPGGLPAQFLNQVFPL